MPLLWRQLPQYGCGGGIGREKKFDSQLGQSDVNGGSKDHGCADQRELTEIGCELQRDQCRRASAILLNGSGSR